MTEQLGERPDQAKVVRECAQAVVRDGYMPSQTIPFHYIGPVFTVQIHVSGQTFTLRGPASHLPGMLATLATSNEPGFTLEEVEAAATAEIQEFIESWGMNVRASAVVQSLLDRLSGASKGGAGP